MTALTTVVALTLLAPAAPEGPEPVDVTACVAKGLKWLAGQQKDDGSWVGRADSQPTPTTAMAGLALLMEGSTLEHGTYAPNLRRAVAWAEKNAQPNGLLASSHRTETIQPAGTHAYGLLFLACAYDVDDDPARRERIGKLLAKAVGYAGTAQTPRGGWGSATARPDDPVTTVTMFHGLTAARRAGIDVPKKMTDRATAYLVGSFADDPAADPLIDDAFGGVRPRSVTGAAASILLDEGRRPGAFARWVRDLGPGAVRPWPARANGAAMSAQLQMARVAHALGENGHRRFDPDAKGDPLKWSVYRAAVFPTIRAAQSADGSWVETVPGPVYGSAVALVILQMENDHIQAFSR